MARGGTRTNAGRKKGSVATHRKLANAATVEAVGDGLTPLAYLLNIMRNEEKPEAVRMDAAKAAAPYTHPRLANIDNTINAGEGFSDIWTFISEGGRK
ncbi:MAG: hypothetical protein Q7T86_03205 [Hyphomicrobiaceae bacterium]|nr:hypothetical protein [Hyphomicrobiaceae bacterium]